MKYHKLQNICMLIMLLQHIATHTMQLNEIVGKPDLFVALDNNNLNEVIKVIQTSPCNIHECYKGKTALEYMLHNDPIWPSPYYDRYYNRYGKYWYKHSREDKNNIFIYVLEQGCNTRGLLKAAALAGVFTELKILLASGKQLYPSEKSPLLLGWHTFSNAVCQTLQAPQPYAQEADPTISALEEAIKGLISWCKTNKPQTEEVIQEVADTLLALTCAFPNEQSLYKNISKQDAFILKLMPASYIRYKALAQNCKKYIRNIDVYNLFTFINGYDLGITLIARNTHVYIALLQKLIESPQYEWNLGILAIMDRALEKHEKICPSYVNEMRAIWGFLEQEYGHRCVLRRLMLTQPKHNVHVNFL